MIGLGSNKKDDIFRFLLTLYRVPFWKGISQINKRPEPVKIDFSGRTIHVTAVMEAENRMSISRDIC